MVRKITEAGYGRYLVRGLHTHQASGKIEWDANCDRIYSAGTTDFGFGQIKIAWREK